MDKNFSYTLNISISREVLIPYCTSYFNETGEVLPLKKLEAAIVEALEKLADEISNDTKTAIEHNHGALRPFIDF